MAETNMTNDDMIEIDLQELIGVLLHRWWLLVICGLVGGIAAFLISSIFITPKYESTTSVYILNKNNSNGTITVSDVQLGTQLTKDYAQLITSRHVLESVIASCELDETYGGLAERVDVKTISDTRLIAITVTDVNPVMAQIIADEIRKVASERIMEVMDIQAVNVVDEANLPAAPASPSVLKWTAMGLLLGFFLCAMILVIQFLLDDTIKTSDDVEKYLELSTLALIPLMETPESNKSFMKKIPAAGKEKRAAADRESAEDREPAENRETVEGRKIAKEQEEVIVLDMEKEVEEGTKHAEH